ncbi:hypothetical protein EYC84_006367 [Monilinia fructicola]|uniref:Uncharacterized protein n=1 Tax=Monilinia fructicola TaxID=38448 RepID=A0A5M9K345_MONFR|nr:hypothetical protein EYC84_006367 [Monilinia fructicola]
MSFGAQALRTVRAGNGSPVTNGEGGFNWSEQLRSRAESTVSQSQRPSLSTSPPNNSRFHTTMHMSGPRASVMFHPLPLPSLPLPHRDLLGSSRMLSKNASSRRFLYGLIGVGVRRRVSFVFLEQEHEIDHEQIIQILAYISQSFGEQRKPFSSIKQNNCVISWVQNIGSAKLGRTKYTE